MYRAILCALMLSVASLGLAEEASARPSVASWYGPGLFGNPTASGEMCCDGFTAAHRTLPFGTLLRVCHEERCVVVRVNDRGPFIDDRELDLSPAAADHLGLTLKGVGKVEILDP